MKETVLEASYRFDTPYFDTTGVATSYFDDNGRITKKVVYDKNGLVSMTTYSYDENTMVCTEILYSDYRDIQTTTTTTYNDNNQPIIERTEEYFGYANDAVVSEKKYEYSESGLLLKSSSSNSSTVYEYNEQNLPLHTYHYLDNSLSDTYEYIYNGEQQIEKEVLSYYDKGEPSFISTTYYEYDDDGRVIKSHTLGALFEDTIFTYEYETDKVGRIIKQTTKRDDRITEIVYFEYSLS